MGENVGGTVGIGGISVGIVVVVAVGRTSVYVRDGIAICAGGCGESMTTVGDNVSVAGLQAANNNIRQSKALIKFTGTNRAGNTASLLSILKGSFVWARIVNLL